MSEERARITVIEWRPFQKGDSLQAFTSIALQNGMIIRGCTWHVRPDGASWLGLPTKSFKKQDGSQGFSKIIDFVDKESYLRFQKAARYAVAKYLAQHAAKSTRGTGEDLDWAAVGGEDSDRHAPRQGTLNTRGR